MTSPTREVCFFTSHCSCGLSSWHIALLGNVHVSSFSPAFVCCVVEIWLDLANRLAGPAIAGNRLPSCQIHGHPPSGRLISG